jgi:hypothetical protein
MPTVVYIGRPQGSAVTDTGTLGEDVMRASSFGKTTKNLWLRRIGARIGSYSGGTKDYRLVAYQTGADHVPTNRLALVGLHSISTVMTSATEGAYVEWDIDTADDGPTNLAEPIYSGTYIALAIEHDTAGLLGHGMVQRADPAFPSGQDDQFRDKTGVATPPTSFGSYTPSTQGVMSIYALCHENDAPEVPINRSIANLDTLTPTFSADFRDNNGAFGGVNDSGDYMRTYRIQVRDASSGTLIWNPAPFSASSGERAANHFSRIYAGTTLTRGNAYEWRTLVTDHFAASSDWSTWLSFTIPAGGTVTAGPTPTGKQDTFTPGPFTGKWTHATSLAMTHVQVRIKRSGTVVRASGDIDIADVASSASPGTTFSTTWASTGFANLPSGSYTFELRGKASDTNYSGWSNGIAFTVDYAPSVPTFLHPDKTVVTTYPFITVLVNDTDDTTGTGLIVKVEIMDATGTVLQTRTMTPLGAFTAEANFGYQTVAADVPAFGVYRYRAYAFDGFLYSGGTTVEASAQRSIEATFTYADGPDITAMSPAEGGTVIVGNPTFTWTCTTQTQFKLRLYNGGVLIFQTNGGAWANSTQQSYTIASGYIHNADNLRWEIEVGDSLGLTAVSTANFTVAFTPPADVAGFQVVPMAIGTDPWPTALRGDWEQSLEVGFVAYAIYRSDLTDPLFYFTSVYDTAFLDFTPVSGFDYVYTVKVIAEVGTDEISSLGVQAEGRVDLGGIVISSVLDPQTVRTALASVQSQDHTRQGTESTYKRWGDSAPSTIRGRGRWWTWEFTALLHDNADTVLDAASRRAEVENLDGIDHTFCIRDWSGLKRFGKIPADGGLAFSDMRFGMATVTMQFRQEAFTEGRIIE